MRLGQLWGWITRRVGTGRRRVAVLVALVAVAALVGTGVSLALTHGSRGGEKESGAASARGDNDQPGEDEDDGGPAAPAEYLTQKFTSGKDPSPQQVRRAAEQANALPVAGGSWS